MVGLGLIISGPGNIHYYSEQVGSCYGRVRLGYVRAESYISS